jgi:hypothetical protein
VRLTFSSALSTSCLLFCIHALTVRGLVTMTQLSDRSERFRTSAVFKLIKPLTPACRHAFLTCSRGIRVYVIAVQMRKADSRSGPSPFPEALSASCFPSFSIRRTQTCVVALGRFALQSSPSI